MAKYTREKQVRRSYPADGQPSTDGRSIPGNADFVDPFRSSNDVLGLAEANKNSNRPADYVGT